MLRSIVLLLMLLALAFLIFGTVINGEVITVDDPHQLQQIEKRHAWNVKKTFIRKNTTGLYYRPLITLSFTADKMLWNADPRMMRSVNIVLHTFNAFLVFFLLAFCSLVVTGAIVFPLPVRYYFCGILSQQNL